MNWCNIMPCSCYSASTSISMAMAQEEGCKKRERKTENEESKNETLITHYLNHKGNGIHFDRKKRFDSIFSDIEHSECHSRSWIMTAHCTLHTFSYYNVQINRNNDETRCNSICPALPLSAPFSTLSLRSAKRLYWYISVEIESPVLHTNIWLFDTIILRMYDVNNVMQCMR